MISKRDSNFFVAHLREIVYLFIVFYLCGQLPLKKYRTKQTPVPALCIDRNLQRHRAVSLQ